MYDHRYRPGEFEQTWHRDGELIEGSENGTHATDLVAAEAVRLIESAGESGQSHFRDIPDPEEFQSLLYRIREERRKPPSGRRRSSGGSYR